MSTFVYYAIAHGMHYGPGKFFAYCLSGRGSELRPLIAAWKTGIVWC